MILDFEYFFNRQKDQENNKIVETPITDEGIQNVDDAASFPDDSQLRSMHRHLYKNKR